MKIVFQTIIALFLFGLSQECSAWKLQVDTVPKEPSEFNAFKDRLYTGGGFGIGLGTVTVVDVSPLLGCKLDTRTSVGIGGSFLYINDRYYDYVTYVYGGKVFGRYQIFSQLFAHVEYETVNYEYYNSSGNLQRKWGSGFLGGAGYSQQLMDNVMVNMLVLWNFLDDPNYPYSNPIIRMGINVGL